MRSTSLFMHVTSNFILQFEKKEKEKVAHRLQKKQRRKHKKAGKKTFKKTRHYLLINLILHPQFCKG